MGKLIVHKTPQEFLDANYKYLLKNELENNLILGICLGLEEKEKEYKDWSFISVINNGSIEAVSFRNTPRVILSGETDNIEAIDLLADYFKNIDIKINAAMGKRPLSEKFAAAIGWDQIKKRIMIVHELIKTNDLTISLGEFIPADLKDLELIMEYRLAFDKEAFGYSRIDYDELRLDMEDKIRKNDLFIWICDNELVSMAAVMRRTKNIGIIGIVYTPEKFRGKGFATSLVMSLSNEIFKRGLSKCGLYTDKSNHTSNDIYYKIGYKPKQEFADIYFGR